MIYDFPIENLEPFVMEARGHGYGAKDAVVVNEADSSKTITYIRGDWEYVDRYYGGEPYGGSEIVKYKGKVVWMMLYYGAVKFPVVDVIPIYNCLKAALQTRKGGGYFSARGPKEFVHKESSLVYYCGCSGDINHFNGQEQICNVNSGEVYSALFMGGLVNRY